MGDDALQALVQAAGAAPSGGAELGDVFVDGQSQEATGEVPTPACTSDSAVQKQKAKRKRGVEKMESDIVEWRAALVKKKAAISSALGRPTLDKKQQEKLEKDQAAASALQERIDAKSQELEVARRAATAKAALEEEKKKAKLVAAAADAHMSESGTAALLMLVAHRRSLCAHCMLTAAHRCLSVLTATLCHSPLLCPTCCLRCCFARRTRHEVHDTPHKQLGQSGHRMAAHTLRLHGEGAVRRPTRGRRPELRRSPHQVRLS